MIVTKKFLGRRTDSAHRARGLLQRGVNGFVLGLDTPRYFDSDRGHVIPPVSIKPRDGSASASTVSGSSSIDPFHEARWQGVFHHRHAEDSIVSQHLTSGLACFCNREI